MKWRSFADWAKAAKVRSTTNGVINTRRMMSDSFRFQVSGKRKRPTGVLAGLQSSEATAGVAEAGGHVQIICSRSRKLSTQRAPYILARYVYPRRMCS